MEVRHATFNTELQTLCKEKWISRFLEKCNEYIEQVQLKTSNCQRALQSLTGKYRDLQGNPCNENKDPVMRTGVPCNENRFSLWELTYRGLPVSVTGFGFAVYVL